MMVTVEARKFHLQVFIKKLENVNQKIRFNTIATESTIDKALAASGAYTEDHAACAGQITGLIAVVNGFERAGS